MSELDAARLGNESVDTRPRLPVTSATRKTGMQARAWAGVYQDLISTQRELLDRLEYSMAEIRALAQEDAAATDEVMLRAQIERFRQRLEYWQKCLNARQQRRPRLGLATPGNS